MINNLLYQLIELPSVKWRHGTRTYECKQFILYFWLSYCIWHEKQHLWSVGRTSDCSFAILLKTSLKSVLKLDNFAVRRIDLIFTVSSFFLNEIYWTIKSYYQSARHDLKPRVYKISSLRYKNYSTKRSLEVNLNRKVFPIYFCQRKLTPTMARTENGNSDQPEYFWMKKQKHV